MKGVIFVEFLEMLDENMSTTQVEALIAEANLPSKGAYTSVGTYNFQEMVKLVSILSEKTDTPVPDLLKAYGTYLFQKFLIRYPEQFKEADGTLKLLERVNDTIHVEVLKLYPDADLPHFSHEWLPNKDMKLTYRSNKPFADVAEGLIRGCIQHFGEPLKLSREDISPAPQTHSIFVISKDVV